MVGKIKKAYIDYAINNGYNLNGCDVLDVIDNKIFFQHKIFGEGQFNLLEIITSKDFIEAIAKGIKKEVEEKHGNSLLEGCLSMVYRGVRCMEGDDALIYDITIQQAIAIRDNKLEDFITNLLDLGK